MAKFNQLVLTTLNQAFATGMTPTIFHSDQSIEFMAQRCTDYLEDRIVQILVSDVASPWQNGFVELFYRRFKQELGDFNRFESVGEMIEAVYRHIHYYNHSRIHTALKIRPAVLAANFDSDNGFHKWGA